MSGPRVDLVVSGRIVVEARAGELATAEAIGIANGRVRLAGSRHEVLDAAGPRTRHIEAGEQAVVPGLHDFHLHLVGMARRRREVILDGLDGSQLLDRVREAVAGAVTGGWLRGRGWHEAAMPAPVLRRLTELVGDRPILLYSHDTHSAWASPAALRMAGIGTDTPGPAGGRIERDAGGVPSGVLREAATDLVEAVAERLGGEELAAALDETLAELAAWGITGATDAGDTSADNGVGEHAVLGDRASRLLGLHERVSGRLRLRVGLPADAIPAAAARGLRTMSPVGEGTTVQVGWAKLYADGALGSRTAALFEPYTCGDAGDAGILRLEAAELDEIVAAARPAGIAVAVHAIGDRALATVLDALERAPARMPGQPPDRIEHLQLVRPVDRRRLATLDVTASMQPVHCAADRPLVEACWRDRAGLAYPWRSLAEAGTRLAFGSDAPIESPSPWLGMFAAVHRRFPTDAVGDWHPEEAVSPERALAGYTSGPAAAAGREDEGHLRPGSWADLAVLDLDLASLLAGDERLAGVRSELTLVGGREVHRS